MALININLLLGLIMHVVSRDVVRCPIELCKCTKFAAICSGKNLIYIPRFPVNVRTITFLNGNIRTLSRESIKNLTFNDILKLNFTNNAVVRLEPETFSNFTTIVALTISSEPSLLATDVMYALNNMKTAHLKSLTLTGNEWSFLPNDMFKAIKTNKIRNINLNRNNFQLLNFSWFSNMSHLLNLRVSFNKISTIIQDSIFSLRKLFLQSNEITKLPKFCINNGNKSALPNLRHLSLINNRIGNIGQFRCFPRLKTLKIGDNWIGIIKNNTFTELKELTDLSLQVIGKPLKKIEDGAFNIPSLQRLSLRDCHFRFERLSPSAQSSMLSSCRDLGFLDLCGNYLNSTILPRIISQLKQLRYLNLENTRLSFLPEGVFPELPVIQTLIMTMNQIYGWDRDVFARVTSLQYLDLRHNLIKIVNESSFPTALLANLKKIGLAKNQFACTCEQIWFVSWLRQTHVTLLEYPKRYYCTTPDNYIGILLKDYKPSVLSCNPIFSIVISISALICL
ncbi:toll-like receptor 3 [Mytilus californianus]|uniref:toll-like receptor 3 n=1 Tax=Mytilus californianus TaxID=6549 RepID=UPI002245E9ED|nr:toll-like receptor 3 [Mytilus californianus]